MENMEVVLATLADRGLRPKVIHNREAKVTAAFGVRSPHSLGVGAGSHLEVEVGIFACCSRDVWIRSRGYQGAIKRLERRPEKLTVNNIAEGDREKIIDEVFFYFANLDKSRQANELFAGLVKYLTSWWTVSTPEIYRLYD